MPVINASQENGLRYRARMADRFSAAVGWLALSNPGEAKSMFRLATCNDLIGLKAKYLPLVFAEQHAWGLKQFGTLFCLDHINKLQPKTLLEIGAGCNTFFDRNAPASAEYWMIDDPGFYSAGDFALANSRRQRTRAVEGLLGKAGDALPDNYFDMVFSISALEHVKVAEVRAICAEMARVLKPGGHAVHTIDMAPRAYRRIGRAYLRSIMRAGLRFTESPGVDYSRVAARGVLLEPLQAIFTYYPGQRADPWTDPVKVAAHTASVAIVVRKPLASERAPWASISLFAQLLRAR
jgi:SAM-dependent methyltransferase